VQLLDKILRMGEGKILRQLESIAKQVSAIEDEFTSLSDEELRAQTDEFKRRYADGESLDDLMPEAFATVREAARRVLGSVTSTSRSWAAPPAPGQHRRDAHR
jgi:preprotein translocase subunit SecA